MITDAVGWSGKEGVAVFGSAGENIKEAKYQQAITRRITDNFYFPFDY